MGFGTVLAFLPSTIFPPRSPPDPPANGKPVERPPTPPSADPDSPVLERRHDYAMHRTARSTHVFFGRFDDLVFRGALHISSIDIQKRIPRAGPAVRLAPDANFGVGSHAFDFGQKRLQTNMPAFVANPDIVSHGEFLPRIVRLIDV
jgi:hypothetical protein